MGGQGSHGPQRPPYGGKEETSEVRRMRERSLTHPGLPIDQRLYAAEERAAGAEELGINLGRELRAEISQLRAEMEPVHQTNLELLEAINGPRNQPKLGLLWKVEQIHDRDAEFRKLKWTLITAACLAVAAWIVQLWVTTHR